jgi:hypothetical protein
MISEVQQIQVRIVCFESHSSKGGTRFEMHTNTFNNQARLFQPIKTWLCAYVTLKRETKDKNRRVTDSLPHSAIANDIKKFMPGSTLKHRQ